MCYRRGAFDHFDAILCVGPHHKEEIRATEALYGLHPKILIEAGYGRLDSILGSESSLPSHIACSHSGTKRVLVAPSWGENSLLENHGPELVEVLLNTGHHITVRPHVMTIRNRRNLLGRLQQRFGSDPNFALDTSLESQGVMHEYDLLVADWGGSALEYAFGLERPVLFVDVPRKVFNPEYERLSCIPIEVQVRSEIGDIVSPDRLREVPERIERLLEDTTVRKDRIIAARSRWVYNLGSSGKAGAEYISSTADNLRNVADPGGKDVATIGDSNR
jgi:YidC/Oxa1 family membrane protein insertase